MIQDSHFENYRTLLSRIDAFSSPVIQRYRQHICCAPGCSDCCQQDLSLFPLEFFFLRHQISCRSETGRGPERANRNSAAEDSCIVLRGGDCTIYPYRPVICRTHGMPLLVRSDQGEIRDCCAKNFLHFPLQAIPLFDLLDLEHVNTILAVLNRAFAAEAGIDANRRIALSRLFSF